MPRIPLRLATALTLLLAAPVTSAQVYLGTRSDLRIQLVDAGAGYLRGPYLLDVAATGVPAPRALDDLVAAAVVDDEIWALVSNALYPESRIYRYDAVSLGFLGSTAILPGKGTYGLVEAGGRAWVVGRKSLFELALDGTLLNTFSVQGGAGLVAWNGELLVSNREADRIDRYDLSGSSGGVFANPGHPLFEDPGRMRQRANGNLLVVCESRIFELDPQGLVVDAYACFPALDVIETSGGRLCASQGPPYLLFCDPDDVTVTIGATYYSPLGRTGARRFCPAVPNSSGAPASIAVLGSLKVKANDIRLFVSGAPAFEPGVFLFGLTRTQVPFADGQLCIGAGAVRLSPVSTGPYGTVTQVVDLAQPPVAGLLVPGVSAYWQFLFRDPSGGPAGANLSDAIAMTFLP